MKISFKDINGIKVKGEVEYIYPRLSQDGKIHSWYFCIKLEDGRFIKGICYKIEDCKFMLDEDENAALYPYSGMMKAKEEIPAEAANKINEQSAYINALIEKEVQMYAEIQKLKKKLAEYEQAGFGFMSKGKIETVHLDSEEETKLQEELAKMKQIVINSEQAQKLSDYINNLHNVVGELKFIPLNEIPAIHLNSFEDCQKLEAEPIKADDSQTKKFAPPFTSVSKVEMYSSDGEKIAETKTKQGDERKAN